MTAAFSDIKTDAVYFVTNGAIKSLAASGVEVARWRSKKFAYPHPVGFGWLRVSGPITDPVTIRLYVDGALIHTATLTTRDPARVPAVKGMRWEVEVESDSRVTSVTLAQAQPELFE
jgi:hypothetical protein